MDDLARMRQVEVRLDKLLVHPSPIVRESAKDIQPFVKSKDLVRAEAKVAALEKQVGEETPLLTFLSKRGEAASNAHAKRMIQYGSVTINGTRARTGKEIVREGDQVLVNGKELKR